MRRVLTSVSVFCHISEFIFFSFMTSKSVIPCTSVYAPIPPAFGKLKALNFSGLGVCLIF